MTKHPLAVTRIITTVSATLFLVGGLMTALPAGAANSTHRSVPSEVTPASDRLAGHLLTGSPMPWSNSSADTGYSFTGTITRPERWDGSDVPASIEGDLTMPNWDSGGVRILYLKQAGSTQRQGIYVSVGGARERYELPGAGTFFIRGRIFDLQPCVQYTIVVGPGGAVSNWQPASGDLVASFEVPCVRTRTTISRVSAERVVLGETVIVEAVAVRSWSDGFRSEDPINGQCILQFRATGGGPWTDASSGPCSASHSPTVPGDYRFLVNGQVTDPVFVNVVRPTSANRVSGVTVSPSSAVANVPLVFSGVLETQYDDEVWRPAPVGTAYELQFLADGGSGWSRLASERVTRAGVVSVRWPMLGSGRFRIVAGSATSESVAVIEVKPTSVVAADPLDLPSEVFPGDPVDISVGVDVQFSDGVYRDAPDGTPFAVEFAESFDPNAVAATAPRSALTWKTLATGKTEGGKADAQVSPRKSGFWRMAFGQNKTSPVYVEVVGSKPEAPRPVVFRLSGSPSSSSVSWAFTPVAGVTYEASASTRSGRVDASQVTLEQSGRVSVSGLPARTAVTVLVTGTDSFGQTDGGATATATTANSTPQPGAAPGPVTAINVSALSRGRVTVTWSAPSSGGDPTSYQYRTRAGKWSAWRSVTAPRVTLTIPTRNRPTTIQIRAVNTTGNGPTQQALL
jgi:hypothetical protein